MTNTQCPKKAAEVILAGLNDIKPKLGLILGSGLGGLADHIEDAIIFDYSDIPGFPVSTVAGHAGRLVIGLLNGMPVACLQGRVHTYEGAAPENVKMLVRTLKLIGCERLLITNASGSLRPEVRPGNLMLISDHINFQPGNPLIGPNDEEYGPRFISMEDAYDPDMRSQLTTIARSLNISISQGVYISVTGPMFETPAEINAFKILGASAVGMSTVPEVIVARHCGLKLAVIAAITNLAAGMSEEKLSHEGTLYYAQQSSHNMMRLIKAYMEYLSNHD